MYNTLTGSEVSASQEDIRFYFDQLDTKCDDVIDLEEYTSSMTSNQNLFEWFDFVNKRITDKLNPPNAKEKKSGVTGYKQTLEDIEFDIQNCIGLIDGKEQIPKKFKTINTMRFHIKKDSDSDLHQSIRTEYLEEVELDNPNSESDTGLKESLKKKPFIEAIEKSTLEKYEVNKDRQIKLLKEKLEIIIVKIREYRGGRNDESSNNRESNHQVIARAYTNKNFSSLKKRNNGIQWGDQD